MTRYANFGTLGFRIVAVLLALYSIVVLAVGTVASGAGSPTLLVVALAGIVAALVLFAVAPYLGRLVARGLTDATAPPNER